MKKENELIESLKKNVYEHGPEFLTIFLEGLFFKCFIKALKNDDLEKANDFFHSLIYLAPEINNIKDALEERDLIWDNIVGKRIKEKYILKKNGEIFEINKKEK